MNESVRNIYCVGRNYKLHAAELGNAVPDQPMIFTKPTHSLVKMDGSEVKLPGNQGEVHYEGELVLRIGKRYVQGDSIESVVDGIALGLDFTLRDVQNELKKKGHPWLAAKGFRNAALVTDFISFPDLSEVEAGSFSLQKNGDQVQLGFVNDMIFSIQVIIEYIALHYGLGAGDMIYTGTPAGVGPVKDGDRLTLLWGDKLMGESVIILG